MKKLKAILLIDDDSIFTWLTKSLLEDMGVAARVEFFCDAGSALDYLSRLATTKERIEEHCPDIIFLDIHMPGINGFAFLERLKELQCYEFIIKRVVVLSTSMFMEDMLRANGYGVYAYLVKPLTETKVNNIVRGMLSRPEHAVD